MSRKHRFVWTAVCICMMLSACGQHHVHLEHTEPIAQQTEVPEPIQTVPVETEPPETTVPETEPAAQQREPGDDSFVNVADYIPGIAVELKYAQKDNFTGQVIYDFDTCYLRYGTVKKLMAVQEALALQGLGLKVWDGFRPVSAQFALWEVCPDPAYVANPETGYSSHSRGNTVDLTVVDAMGREVEMPTEFDDFSALADRDYSDCGPESAENARMLQSLMEDHGFTGYFGEWWHFSDTEKYDVETVFDPAVVSVWYAKCEEFISLRTQPDTSAEVITRIPVGEEFTLLGYTGEFSMVEYQGMVGYVLTDYTFPVTARDTLAVPRVWVPNCDEYITLRANMAGDYLDKILLGESFSLLNWAGEYAQVEFRGKQGYVLSSYIRPEAEAYMAACLDIVSPTAKYSHSRMLEDLAGFARKYPEDVALDSLGTSELGREIPVLRIGREDAQHHVLVQGAIHGREHMTAWLLMAMADYWMEHGYADYPDVCCHLIPMVNPDGVTVSQTGQLDDYQLSLYSADLHSGHTEAEQEEYALLWKANGLGVDLNRNFPAGWELAEDRQVPSAMLYRGKAPFCAAETAALREYTLSRDFDATVSYHASGCVIYWEYGTRQDVNARSHDLAQHLQATTGYVPQGSDGVDGAGYKDWAMEELGIPSVTVEIGCGAAPLAERELYAIFARNAEVLEAIAQWAMK